MRIAGSLKESPYAGERRILLYALFLMSVLAALFFSFRAPNYRIVFLGFLGVALFITLIKRPILAAAIFFNGQAIYFYLLYKLRLATSTVSTGVFFSILVFAFFIGMLLRKKHASFRQLDLWVGLIFLWILTSYLLGSFGIEWATRKLVYAPILAIAPYLMGKMIQKNIEISKFLDGIIGISKILAVIFLGELLFSSQFRAAVRYSPFEFEGIDNPILVGITFAIPLLIICTSILEGRQRLDIPTMIWMTAFAYLSIRAASRGAIISFCIGLLGCVFLMKPRMKNIAKLITLGIIVLILAYSLPHQVVEFYRETGVQSDANSATQRLNLWQKALADFARNPFLGSGFGNFYNELPSMGQAGPSFAHNIFLETGAELGLIGLVLLVIIFFLAGRALALITKLPGGDGRYTLLRTIAPLLIYSISEAQFSGFLTGQTYLFMMLGIMANWTCRRRIERKAESQCVIAF